MEHRNGQSKKTLNAILETRFAATVIMTRMPDIESIEQVRSSDLVYNEEFRSSNIIDKHGNVIVDKDSYIRQKHEQLFRMLDAVIVDARSKLHKGNTKRYSFNDDNAEFINWLLDGYGVGNFNFTDLAKKRYDRLEDDFLDILHEGLLGLAKNEETNLSVEEVEQEWNLLFNPISREISDILDTLKGDVEFYVMDAEPRGGNLIILEEIKNTLKKCVDDINTIAKGKIEFFDLEIDGIPIEELPVEKIPILTPIIDMLSRRERAKKGWEKRRRNN